MRRRDDANLLSGGVGWVSAKRVTQHEGDKDHVGLRPAA